MATAPRVMEIGEAAEPTNYRVHELGGQDERFCTPKGWRAKAQLDSAASPPVD